ncbi:DUF4340 domain-containing protein [uncultured Paraglaciecola sp.]|uniref:DUF4340 domain-containing protein n=1 Tax=uncultured Paraglaciecola sp. TaxID=1765024 RepID=UPI0025DE1B01|nr:DUF4340 domain-containing protein [uncultured Paraglaciecola sp.]
MNKQVSVLAVIAILAVGLGVWLSQPPSTHTFETELLFDDLQKMANQVDSVEITNAQGVLLSAKKSAENWLATIEPEQSVYPVSHDKLADLVETLMQAKLVEAKTRKPKNYIRLGLQSIDTQDSMATLVTIKASGNSWQVLVGNEVTFGEGHYILKPKDAQSWRTDKTISLPIDIFSWLKQPILPYQEQDINAVSRVDSLDWQIARSANGDFQLMNKPTDKELEYASILNSIVSNLTNLKFEQVLAANDEFTQSLKVLTQLEVTTTDETTFQVVVSELDGNHYVNFNVSDPSEYWQKGYFQVSNFSAQQLMKTTEDFLVEENNTTGDIDTSSKAVDEGDSPY